MATIKVELELEENDLKQYVEENGQNYSKYSKWEYISSAMDELPFVVNVVQVDTDDDDFDDYYSNEDEVDPIEFDCD